jgi:hypothetical protein
LSFNRVNFLPKVIQSKGLDPDLARSHVNMSLLSWGKPV